MCISIKCLHQTNSTIDQLFKIPRPPWKGLMIQFINCLAGKLFAKLILSWLQISRTTVNVLFQMKDWQHKDNFGLRTETNVLQMNVCLQS